jgi:hypothetical protein
MSTSLPKPMYRSFSVWIAALVCLSGSACFRTMDPTKILCVVNKSSCPTNYSCVIDNGSSGHCQLGNVTHRQRIRGRASRERRYRRCVSRWTAQQRRHG